MKHMLQSIFVDLNIIMDLTMRRPGYMAARNCLKAAEEQGVSLYMSAHLITTFAYLMEREGVAHDRLYDKLLWAIDYFQIVGVDRALLRMAVQGKHHDFEDKVVELSAELSGCGVILTRNLKDFRGSLVPAYTPEQFLRRMESA